MCQGGHHAACSITPTFTEMDWPRCPGVAGGAAPDPGSRPPPPPPPPRGGAPPRPPPPPPPPTHTTHPTPPPSPTPRLPPPAPPTAATTSRIGTGRRPAASCPSRVVAESAGGARPRGAASRPWSRVCPPPRPLPARGARRPPPPRPPPPAT